MNKNCPLTHISHWPTEDTDEIARTVYLKMPPKSIVRLQGYLDLSENMGVLRTVSAEEGIVSLLTTQDMLKDCFALLDCLKESLQLEASPACLAPSL